MSLGLPVEIDDDAQYREKLKDCFQEYNEWAENFVVSELRSALCQSKRAYLQPDWCDEKSRLEFIETELLSAVDNYYTGGIFAAQEKVYKLIDELTNFDELNFLVSDIDRSYSTRLVAPFPALHHPIIDNSEEYDRMNAAPLSFFRGRKERIENCREMLHIPLNQRDKVATQRFSVPGTPCLYLGASSCNIWRELGCPSFDKFNVSALRLKPLTERGTIKILNLIANRDFLLGSIAIPNAITEETVRLLLLQLQIWPIVCATSFKVKNSVGFFHSEYIISHLIMLNLPRLNLDGVAYVSKQIDLKEENFALPLMVNFAIPVISTKLDCKYGDVCSKFEITDPVNLQEFQGIELEMESLPQQSYFCQAFTRTKHTPDLIYAKRSIGYRKTTFFRLDNFLCNQQFYSYDSSREDWLVNGAKMVTQ